MRQRSGGALRVAAAIAAVVGLVLALAACGGGSAGAANTADHRPAGTSTTGASGEPGRLSGTLTIFAAASLQVTFDELRQKFAAAHPGVAVKPVTYDGSSTLATQITEGAPADVFASADEANMNKVASLVTDRVDFATNTLEIAVAPGNPKHIEGLASLARPGVVTVVCAPQVPCGTASRTALAAAGVTLQPASEEQNVTAVLTKVETGDADAGLVYKTDVHTAGGRVAGVDFPQAAKAVNTYPIAVLKGSANRAAAEAFVRLVTSPAGQEVLASVGFGKP